MFKQVALYAGFPVANDAFRILKALLHERQAKAQT